MRNNSETMGYDFKEDEMLSTEDEYEPNLEISELCEFSVWQQNLQDLYYNKSILAPHQCQLLHGTKNTSL